MAKQQKVKQQEVRELTGLERLGLRVSAMIGSPVAQLQRWVTIHRLDTDDEEAWEGVMELLAETNGIDITFNDDGTLTLNWERESDEDRVMEVDDLEAVAELAPF